MENILIANVFFVRPFLVLMIQKIAACIAHIAIGLVLHPNANKKKNNEDTCKPPVYQRPRMVAYRK